MNGTEHPRTMHFYGACMVDSKGGWDKAEHELVMVQNGLDIDLDGANDFYAVNFIPFHFDRGRMEMLCITGLLIK